MTKTAENIAETTEIKSIFGVLDDTLRSLRISGSLLIRETYAAPWAIAIPPAKTLGSLLAIAERTQVVAFHLVEFGHCEIKPEVGESLLLNAGDMAICFGGQAHRLSAGSAKKAQPIETLLAGEPNRQSPAATERPAATALLCGAFLLHYAELNPLVAALPPILHATLSRSGELHNLSGVARLLAAEIERSASGSGYVIERLLEVLCADAIRAHLETSADQSVGWFRGLKDTIVGRAIAAIHVNPSEDWSVPLMAQGVSMSPSRFAARFVESVGDSPMAYVAKWRMNVACRKLAGSQSGIDQIAAEVGYQSLPAFSRAFKKHVGLPPAAWRAQQHG